MCNKKQLIELVMNRPMGAVRYKLVRRLFQMTEKEAELLLKIMMKEKDGDASQECSNI